MATPTQNTIHQGAATLIAEATTPPVTNPATEAIAARRTAVDLMVGTGQATEADRNELVQMSEIDFKAVQNYSAKRKAVQNQQYLPMPVTNQAPAATGLEPWLQAAPPEIAELVRNSLARDEEEKTTLIDTITANRNNKFNPDWLKTQKVVMLRGIAALAGVPQTTTNVGQPNYGGQGEVPMLLPSQINNQQTHNIQQESLPLPRVFTSEAG